ncbi:MAG TPA: PAS domain S-box protein, partial [Longimicrobiales bacterium]|nr:PAS domain S-box protein [Longimicrobiales bacterium]
MADQDPIRVLLIDDEEQALHLTRAILDQIPGGRFVLDFVDTAAEGEVAMARGAHDVYLVDYMLGDASGIELVRRARAARNRAPMILLTGKGRYEVDVEAMEAGVSDYLDKEKVDPDLLERSLRYAVERVRAEAALRDSEARHRSLFEHLPIGLYRATMDGDLVDANPALVSMLGHPDRETMESLYARNFFVGRRDREPFLKRLEREGVLRGFESELTRPDGGIVQTRNAARGHQHETGETAYIEGAVEDVSEESTARTLRGRAARFAWIFEASGLAILVLDLNGTVIDANAAFRRAFGYGPDDLQGRPLVDLAEARDREALADELREVAHAKGNARAIDRRFV